MALNVFKKLLTLCLAIDSDRVLLGMKKRGFGAGRWNGFGGKVEPGETIEEAARREMFEEVGLTITQMERVGNLTFEFVGNPELLEVHLFRVKSFEGIPMETDEMRPQWFDLDAIPFHLMWPDDPHWFPLFLDGRTFKASFTFGTNDQIVDRTITETDTF